MHALITGTLHKTPENRTSTNGNGFTLATLKTTQKNRDGATEGLFVSVIAFNEQVRETLERLDVGDTVSLGGTLNVGVWTDREGHAHPQLNLIAETAATAKPKPKPKATRARPARHPAPGRQDGRGGFDDPIAF